MAKLIKERVDELEKEVAELKLIVHELRKSSTVEEVSASVVEDAIEFEGKSYKKVDRLAREGDVVVFKDGAFVKSLSFQFEFEKNKPYEVFSNVRLHNEFRVYELMYNRTPETVDVYELIEQTTVEDKSKTANELRDEVIEKAKSFVVENGADYTFEVDEENRTVFAYKLFNPRLAHYFVRHGFSKCRQNDVFNSHIGKAIALGRVKKLDVSEFEQAVQPTEVVVGMEIEGLYNDLYKVTYVKDDEIGTNNGPARFFYKHRFENGQLKIINDTNAIYGGVE